MEETLMAVIEKYLSAFCAAVCWVEIAVPFPRAGHFLKRDRVNERFASDRMKSLLLFWNAKELSEWHRVRSFSRTAAAQAHQADGAGIPSTMQDRF